MHESCITNRSLGASTQLDELVAQISARVEAGEPIDLAALTADCPQYREQLEMLLPTLEAVVQLERGLTGRTESSATSRHRPGVELENEVAVGLTPGRLGDFQIRRELGRGGMGVVFEAEQISLGRRVALKVLPFAAMLDTQQLARFKNEARAAATLDHPSIVSIYSVGVDRGVHFYAMQLIDGQSLAELILAVRETTPGTTETTPIARLSTMPSTMPSKMPEFASRDYCRAVARLGVQAAEALDHAHQNGILHRDIKPANLLVDESGRLWITDFGLARMEQDAGMTMTGDVLGTLRYMSPEQALAQRAVVDHRSDVYSLGATLYELLTLRPVFAADDRQELLRQIAVAEPKQLRQINAQVSPDLETIVHKSLEKNPADRYATAAQLAGDLQRYLASEPIQAKPPGLATRAGRWVRRHRAIAASGGIVLAVVVLASLVSSGLLLEERRRTMQASEESKAVQEFLVEDLLAAAQDETRLGREVTVGELLAKADEKVEQAFANQPAVEAAVRLAIAKSYNSLGRYDKAEVQAKQALALQREMSDAITPEELEIISVLCTALTLQKKEDEARTLSEEALVATEREFGLYHPETIKSYGRLASACLIVDRQRAKSLSEKTLKLIAATPGIDERERLNASVRLLAALINCGQPGPAEELGSRLVEETRAALGPEDRLTLEATQKLTMLRYNVANVTEDDQTQQERFCAVVTLAEELYQIQRRVLGDLDPDTNLTVEVLAKSMLRAGDLDGCYVLTMDYYRRTSAAYGQRGALTMKHFSTIALLARAYVVAGEGKRSVELATLACDIGEPDTADYVSFLAAAHARAGNLEEAEKWGQEVLKLVEEDWQRARLVQDGPDMFKVVADAYAHQKDFTSAVRWMECVLEFWPDHKSGPKLLAAYRAGKRRPD